MSDDLTKLSGPELADVLGELARVHATNPELYSACVAACDYMREDTRGWQRKLERERDQLRAELAESRRLIGTMATADLEGARDYERLKHWRKWAESFWCVFDTDGSDGAVMNAIAVKLHAAETRAESAENQLKSEASKPLPVIKLEAGDAYVADLMSERDHWKSKALGTQAQIDRDDRIAQGMSTAELVAELKRSHEKRENQRKELHTLNVERAKTLTKLEDAQKRIAELEEQLSAANGSLTSMQHNAERRGKRVRELEAQLRDAQNAGAYEWTADGEAVPEQASVPPPRPVTDEEMRAATEEVRDLHAKREAMVGPGQDALLSDAVISTANLSAFEVAAANAADALLVYADGMGFVKRAWLDRHRASVAQQRKILAEPADQPAPTFAPGTWVRNKRTWRVAKVADKAAPDDMGCVVVNIDGGGYGHYWARHLCEPCAAPEPEPEPAERKPPFTWTDEDKARVVPGSTVMTRGCRVAVDGGHNEGYGDFLYGPGRSPTYDASLCDPQSLLPPDPAERKPHEAQLHGPDAMTLENVMASQVWASSVTHHLAIHLRELLDERKAIEALADELVREGDAMESASFNLTRGGYDQGVERGEAYGRRHAAQELREVLNGKR